MVFIEAKAIFISDGETVEVTACAGVEHRKGMDLAMSFGAYRDWETGFPEHYRDWETLRDRKPVSQARYRDWETS